LIVARVLVVDLERVWRGGQEQAFLLMKGLKKRGHRVEIVAVRNSAVALRAQAAGIQVHAVADRARRISAARQVRLLLKQKRFELVYANEAHALTAAWLAGSHRHVPLVAARRVTFPLSRSPISLARYRAATRILAISQAVHDALAAAGIDEDRVEVVPDGVEIPSPIKAETRGIARKRWGFKADDSVLALVAALTEEKGHALLIEAFSLLRREVPNCRLLLAGEGKLRAQLERQVREADLESVATFAGFVPDVESVYAACDLFVFPSLQEGAGSSLLKAMAFGLPALALARGGVSEIVESGQNGILVQEATAEAISAEAARMLRDPALMGRLGQSARETAAAQYSADRMVDATARIFERLISGAAAVR
jgi:glycosyltransferase involved in cell wall biosynthesis